jgi:hypothetical protein
MARDYVGEIDLFAAYCPENDGVYLVPSEEAPRRAMRLRVDESRNRQIKHVRWACDYELPA